MAYESIDILSVWFDIYEHTSNYKWQQLNINIKTSDPRECHSALYFFGSAGMPIIFANVHTMCNTASSFSGG